MSRGHDLLRYLEENSFSEEERTQLWKLSELVGGRSQEDRLVLDALCCILHVAVDRNLNLVSLIQAAELHVQRETDNRIKILSDLRQDLETSRNGSSTAGDRLIIHCLETGRFWNDAHGWVNDPLEATTYDSEKARNIDMPQGNCATAEVSHVRDLIQIKEWRIRAADDA